MINNKYYKGFTLEFNSQCTSCSISLKSGDERYVCSECFDVVFCVKCYSLPSDQLNQFHKDSAPLPHIHTKETKTEDQHYSDNKSDSVYQSFINAFNSFSERRCFGERQGSDDYQWITYKQVYESSEILGTSLSKLIQRESKVGILLKNTPKWFYIEFGCLFYGFTTIPLNQNLSVVDIAYLLEKTEIDIIFVSKSTFSKLISALELSSINSLKYIIHLEDDIDIELQNKVPSDIQIKTYNELIGSVSKDSIARHSPLQDGILTLGASSGSTGKPKLLICRDRDVSHTIHDNKVGYPYVNLSYLSLSQGQRKSDFKSIANGGRIGIFSSELDHIFEDIQLLRPTAFWGPPKIWNMIHGNYHSELNQYKLNHPTLSNEQCEIQFKNQFKKLFGDRIQTLISGGSLISEDILSFMKDLWGNEKVLDVYGSMEAWHVLINNEIYPGVEYKIQPINLEINDKPIGELMVKSKSTIIGYYKNQQANEELFSDGWLKMGDLVKEYEPSKIRIIDRIKNTFKLSSGKFVGPESIELHYYKSELIKHIFIHGYSGCDHLYAIVVPSDLILTRLNLKNSDNLDSNEQLKDLIFNEIQLISKEKAIVKHEIPKAIKLDNTTWTIENKCLNGSGKFNRLYLKEYYSNQLTELFAKKDQIDDNFKF